MRRPDYPVEEIPAEVPLLLEAVVMAFAMAVAGLWLGILSHAI